MPDATYKYNGSGLYYGDPVVVRGSWPANIQKMWTDALAGGYTLQGTTWVPTYDSITVYWPGNDGTIQSFTEDNAMEFPTLATCQKLAELYGAKVLEIPFFTGGPTSSNAVKRYLQWPTVQLEAWPLANAYTNNSPALADQICKALIAGAQQ